MKIEKLEVYLVRLPLKKPFLIADRSIDSCETVFLAAHGGGLTGWGEVTPGNRPYLTEESSSNVFATIRSDLFPLVGVGRSHESAESLAGAMTSIRRNRHAKGAFDLAWRDLDAKMKGEPLWKSIGGKRRPIQVGLTFDRFSDREDFYAELTRARDEKFHRITIKMRPGWDIQAVNAARDFCPWPTQIQVDIEGALSLEKHADLIYRLQDFMPLLIEQPLHPSDLVSHAILQESLRVPVGLDESIPSLLEAGIAIDLGSAKAICLKPGRTGGLTETKAVHDAALEANIPCYGGFDIGSSVAYRHLLAAAALPGSSFPADYIRFDEVFVEEPGVPLVPTLHEFPGKKPTDSTKEWEAVELWDEPGIGFEPDREIIEKYAVDQSVME